ncbi:uncharacterized protein LOC136032182 isoform X2 [Artemia franciscana]|uniref:uncharacterized protein LOC136032182 isoform X2 n=2 Tax=Artemia franciscana TaxID=6661 RepID=UPI0032DA1C2B
MASENGFNGTGPVKTALATKDGLYMGTLNAAQPTGGPQQSMDMSDPNVKKLVYNLYRGLLGTYNDKANDVVASCPDAFVTEDQGIARQVESMLRQSSEIQARNGIETRRPLDRRGSVGAALTEQKVPIDRRSSLGISKLGDMSPPPPPPPPPPGVVLSSRQGEVNQMSTPKSHSRVSQNPPSAISGSMMRDKKPFTYTPGGLDLSEIRSPRMAKRISKNALYDGSPSQQQGTPGPLSTSELPPQAAAAIQPQIAVQVLPQSNQPLRSTSRQESYPPPPPHLPAAEQPQAINTPEDLPKINPEIVRQLNNHLLAQAPARVASPVATSLTGQEELPPTRKSIDREKSPMKLTPTMGKADKPVVMKIIEREQSPAGPPPPVRQSSAQLILNQIPQSPPSDFEAQRIQNPKSSSNLEGSNYSPNISPIPNGKLNRNAQMGALYIPPVEKNREQESHSQLSSPSPPSSSCQVFTPNAPKSSLVADQSPQPCPQLKNTPLPWMNSNVKSHSPPPSWIGERDANPLAKVRIIPIQMEGSSPPAVAKPLMSQFPQGSGYTRVIPIQVEDDESPKPTQFANQTYMESPQLPSNRHPVQHQISVQRLAKSQPIEPQDGYNQVVGNLDNMNLGGESPINSKQLGAPTQSRSFRILQLITDTTDGTEQEDTIDHTVREAEVHTDTPQSRRTSERRSSNSSGGSYQGFSTNVPQERRLVLEEGDKELMELFKQKGVRRDARTNPSEELRSEPVFHTDQLTSETPDASNDMSSLSKRGSQILSDTLSTRLHQLLSLAHGAASSLLNTVHNAGEENENDDDEIDVEDQPVVIHRWHQDLSLPESSMYTQENTFQKPVIIVDSFDSPRSSKTYAFDTPRGSISLEKDTSLIMPSTSSEELLPTGNRRKSVSTLVENFESSNNITNENLSKITNDVSVSFSISQSVKNDRPSTIQPCRDQPLPTTKRPPVPPPKPKRKNAIEHDIINDLPLKEANISSVEKLDEMCTDIHSAAEKLEAVASGLQTVDIEVKDQANLKEVVVINATELKKKSKRNKKKKKKQNEVSTQTRSTEKDPRLKVKKASSFSDSAISSATSVEENGEHEMVGGEKVHCRLFRILTDEPEGDQVVQSVCTRSEASLVDTASEAPSLADESESTSVVLRRSRINRHSIPSKVFQFIQSEFDDGNSYSVDEERNFTSLSRQSSLLSPTTPSSSAMELEQIFAQFAARK